MCAGHIRKDKGLHVLSKKTKLRHDHTQQQHQLSNNEMLISTVSMCAGSFYVGVTTSHLRHEKKIIQGEEAHGSC